MFYAFLLIHCLYSAALQGTRPIVSIYADDRGASPAVIGLLASAYALFPMLLAVRTGRWLDRYGARRMVAVGATGMLVSLLVPMLYPSVGTLFFSQILRGCSQLFVHLSLQKTVGNLPGDRDKIIAALTLTGSLGEFIGPLISGFGYEHYGFRVSFGILGSFVLLALVIGFLLGHAAWKSGAASMQDKHQVTGSAWKMLHQVDLRNALIISGLVLYSKDLFVAYFPVYASDIGLSPGMIGGIISIMAGMSMVVRLFQFQLVQAFGRGPVLMGTLLVSGICYLLIPSTSALVLLASLAALLGAGLGLGQPLSLVYALNVTLPERHGEVLGVRITFNRAFQFASQFLFGGIGGVAGLAPIFWISGAILLLGSYLTRMRGSEPKNAPPLKKGE